MNPPIIKLSILGLDGHGRGLGLWGVGDGALVVFPYKGLFFFFTFIPFFSFPYKVVSLFFLPLSYDFLKTTFSKLKYKFVQRLIF